MYAFIVEANTDPARRRFRRASSSTTRTFQVKARKAAGKVKGNSDLLE